MALRSSYPVLATRDVGGAARFWTELFGFEPTFTSEWYVSLRRDAWEIAVLDADHTTIPPTHRGRTSAGVLINLEVEDVDAEHERLRDLVPIVLPLRSEPFGQRHFIAQGPDGVLVDVITPIPPSAEFAAAFA